MCALLIWIPGWAIAHPAHPVPTPLLQSWLVGLHGQRECVHCSSDYHSLIPVSQKLSGQGGEIGNCPPWPPSSYTPGTIYIVLVGGTSWSKWVCALLIWLMFFILPSSPPFYQASFTSLLLKDWGSLVEFRINAQSKFTLLEVTINSAACHKNLS